MKLAERSGVEGSTRRSIREVRATGLAAIGKLAEAERLRAEAVADLVEFDAIDGHVIEGYLTPQRQLVHGAGLTEGEANRVHRIVRFCADHPRLIEALGNGGISVDHADVLCRTATHVDAVELARAMPDLLDAAAGVEVSTFLERVRTWQWRVTPEETAEDCETAFERRSVTMQPGLFGGVTGRFEIDAAGAGVLVAALTTEPDPLGSLEPPRTLGQRRADRLVELAALAQSLDVGEIVGGGDRPEGARQVIRSTVDVVIDLPTLLGVEFDLNDHRTREGNVDWDSLQASFTWTGPAPKPVITQFLCDASWRALVTSGRSAVLDYAHARPELTPALRRVVQRRDRHCQFHGCDRHWSWCDVHHLTPREEGGRDHLENLALVCRRHHTMIHSGGWRLDRGSDGRIATTSP